jgi:hypothetical protein
LAAKEEKLGNEENQALTTHAKKGKSKKEVHSHKSLMDYKRYTSLRRISQITNATFVRRWDTLR